MRSLFTRKTIAAAVSLTALAFSASPAISASLVLNGSFENATATVTSFFSVAGVADWTDGGSGETLVTPNWYTNGYLYPPNFSYPGSPAVGVAGPFPQYSPDGGNFVFADGNYSGTGPISQTITGMTTGDTYQLTFYQALAEDTEPGVTFPGPVTGSWEVSLGTNTQFSPNMNADGTIPTVSLWTQETMTFVAQNASDVLSFLAIGSGQPPLVGLDGVSLVDVTAPEPASFGLAGICAIALGWKLIGRHRAESR